MPQPSRSLDPVPAAPHGAPDSLHLARAIAHAAESRQGENLLVLDIAKTSSFADYFVLISGDSERHVKAIFEAIVEEAAKLGVKPHGIEGESDSRWILVDFIDVVVHIFLRDLRSYYNLDRIWADAPEVSL